MRAATHYTYGSPDVLQLSEVERPHMGPHDVLVRVYASPVTQGDRRLRAADYPGFTQIFGRLVSGLLRPRHPISGSQFAGQVINVGSEVTQFAMGDHVFGSTMHSAQAEFISVPETAPIAKAPQGLAHDEIAALPYGAVTALFFLRDLAQLQPGERVLIVGVGGVGRFAVQLAKHFGAHVTAVSSREFEDVRRLGADEVIDYTHQDFTKDEARYDVILDTSGTLYYPRIKHLLTHAGRYFTLFLSMNVLYHMVCTRLVGMRRASVGVALGTPELLRDVASLAEQGVIQPTIARHFPIDEIAMAHRHLERDKPYGSVIIHLNH